MTTASDPLDPALAIPLRTVADDQALALDVVPESLPPGALERPVRWAHVSELRNPAPYLLGQELLLTAGVNLPADPAAVDRYVLGLRSAGITALGFGITPPMHDALPVTLRAACVRLGVPLLVVPIGTPFLAISRSVALAIGEARDAEQRRITEAREALTKLATGGAGEVVRGLAQRISGWVAVVDAEDELTAEHRSPRPLPGEVTGLFARLRAGSGIRSATTELADGTFVMAQPVYPQATAAHLLAVGRAERLGSTDRAIVAVGTALLGLVGREGSGAARLGTLATSWLLGRSQPAEALATVLPAREYRVVAGVADGPRSHAAETGYDWLRSRLRTPFIELAHGSAFNAIVGRPPDEDVSSELRNRGWLVAVGRPHTADRLATAMPEVRALLQRAASLGRPVTASGGEGLASLVLPDAAATYADRTLGPLNRSDSERAEAVLVPTLRAWLAHHGSWDRTANALGIHRNSVRHRIRQAERALGVDLTDPDARMELWFALHWSG